MRSFLECSMTAAALLAMAGFGTALRAQDAPQPQLAVAVTANKGAQRLTTLSQTAAATTSSTVFVNLASTTITIPSGQTGRLLATFSGEAQCNGAAGWCSVRILVDGVEMSPAAGSNFAFTTPGDLFWESKSMDRISAVLGPGTKTVTVQWRIVSPATSFRLDDWQLTVVFWRVS